MNIISNNLKVREVIHQVVNDPEYKQVSNIPLISRHQLALIFISYAGVFSSISLYLYTETPIWIMYPIMIFCFYTAFTPLHDATHRAVSSNNIVNDILGTISGFILFPLSNVVGYRHLHLAHHRYVGDKDLDPDEPMVYIPTKYFPIGYLSLLLPDLLWVHWMLFKAWKRTPIKTRANILFMILGNITFHIIWFLSPFAYEYLILFFIPNRLGIAYVALTFAHLPHPEGLKQSEHPFKATFTLTGNKYFTWSLYGQKHHSMHHFLPHIPWYKYFKVWKLANGTFQKQQIPQKKIFSKPDIHFKDTIINKATTLSKNILVNVTKIENTTDHIKTFILQATSPKDTLPEFTAGAHIDIFLPSGNIRSYSCINPPYQKNCYQIAVKLEKNGNGGSKEMHESITIGSTLKISQPKHNFVLYENVNKYILIAGGIGITPLLSMSHRLTEIEKHFELHICAKSKNEIPFRYELKNCTFAPNVEIHIDKNDKSSIAIDKVLAQPNKDTLIYICGPTGFNHWIEQSALNIGWDQHQIKQEAFTRIQHDLLPLKSFELILHKSQKSINVSKNETIIDALHRNNINAPYSCLQGTCGTCITNVISGNIDHRDAVLSNKEKLEHTAMCICVSRATDNSITIDL